MGDRSAVSDREQTILGIIETARGKKAKFRDSRITMAHGAGGKATQSLIEGLPRGETVAGKHIAVIEDVTTTGGSSLKAVAVLRAAGATVRTVLTLLDRQEGAGPAFAAAGVTLKSLLTSSDFRS